MNAIEPKKLDGKKRCCGRKPISYMRPPHFFCCRCNASFDRETGVQIENWAFKSDGNGHFVPKYPKS